MEQLTFDLWATDDAPSPRLCECGCGEPTRIAKQNNRKLGHVKGQGVRFLRGHSQRGKIFSDETRAKLSDAASGDRSVNWKGDDVTYHALHAWLRTNFPKSGICDECGLAKRTDYALIHGRAYSRDRDDYRELCRACHLQYDLGGKSVLSNEAKLEIRQKSAGGRSYPSLAAEYGVGVSLIGRVVTGKPWRSPGQKARRKAEGK